MNKHLVNVKGVMTGMEITYKSIAEEAERAIRQFLDKANLPEGSIFVVGCSSSEIKGEHIGKGSDINAAEAVYNAIYPILSERGIYLAAQCCEHLNRAIIVEKSALKRGEEIVNVIPKLHAGGSFAVTVYDKAKHPAAVEHIKADGGMDIGDTLIGMHLKDVAVPVRIEQKKIGSANVVCARTRPKFIGGERAQYDKDLIGGEIRR